jgi:predicted TIM-barrel fold metal-dependent hydrolase
MATAVKDLSALNLSSEGLDKIERENALKLFPRLASRLS